MLRRRSLSVLAVSAALVLAGWDGGDGGRRPVLVARTGLPAIHRQRVQERGGGL